MVYTDIAYCDTVLSSAAWVAATDTAKQTAIDTGALWIDKNYSCSLTSPVQDSIQLANALLSDKYINNTLFVQPDQVIESKSVKAGSVETEKTYFKGIEPEDQFSEINLHLSSVCAVNYNTVFKTVRV